MATHSSVFVWRIPGMGEPGGLPSMGSHRVGHDWSDLATAGLLWGLNGLIHLNHLEWLLGQSKGKTNTLTDFLKYEYSILNFFYIYYSLKYYYYENESVKVLVAQPCPSVCNPMDCSPPGYCVHGIFQVRVLKWVAIPFSKGSSQPRDQTWVFCTAGRFFSIWATREAPTIIITTLKKKKNF